MVLPMQDKWDSGGLIFRHIENFWDSWVSHYSALGQPSMGLPYHLQHICQLLLDVSGHLKENSAVMFKQLPTYCDSVKFVGFLWTEARHFFLKLSIPIKFCKSDNFKSLVTNTNLDKT